MKRRESDGLPADADADADGVDPEPIVSEVYITVIERRRCASTKWRWAAAIAVLATSTALLATSLEPGGSNERHGPVHRPSAAPNATNAVTGPQLLPTPSVGGSRLDWDADD